MPNRIAAKPVSTTLPKTVDSGPRNKELAATIDNTKKQLKSLGWLAKSLKRETVKIAQAPGKAGTKATQALEKIGVKLAKPNDGFDSKAPKKK